MEDIKSYTLDELTGRIKDMGYQAYRARQLYEWMHKKAARSFEEMTNIPGELRSRCEECFEYTALTMERMQ